MKNKSEQSNEPEVVNKDCRDFLKGALVNQQSVVFDCEAVRCRISGRVEMKLPRIHYAVSSDSAGCPNAETNEIRALPRDETEGLKRFGELS